MKRYTQLVACCLVMLSLMPLAAYAQGQASVLTPITPPDIEPWNKEPLIMTNDQGHVLVVYHGERAKAVGLHSAYFTGGSWQPGEVPLPAGIAKWRSTELYNLAWHGSRFALLLRNWGNKYYYTLWSGNSWSAPALIPDDIIKNPRRVNFDASGNLIFWDSGYGKGVTRLVGGQYQSVVLPMRLEHFHNARNELIRGRTGAIHIAGASARNVPTVASLAAASDPLQAANWVVQPPENDENTAPTREMTQSRQVALDWPRQMLWASWEKKHGIFISHAPLGANNNAQWVTWEVPVDEGWQATQHRLTASTGGADGVVYVTSDRHGGQQLLFRWLPPNGLGQELQLVRPGSQTEAADFSQLYNGTLALVAAPDGVAHVIIKGKKRGEYPENAERLYYSRVSGGATLANEPGVTGGGQQVDTTTGGQTATGGQDWRQQGGKPDLSPVITMKAKPVMCNGQPVYRYGYHSRIVAFDVGIHNGASQYFGDVEVDILVDGAVAHYRKVDDSKHMRAMIERDATLVLRDLPGFKYELSPLDGWQAPELSTADGRLPGIVPMRTGLGRKLITVVVDPNNEIDEIDETNNIVQGQYVVADGSKSEDRQRVGGEWLYGLNDLSVVMSRPRDNTDIWTDSFAQRETQFEAMVLNRREAAFFLNVPLTVYLDGVVMSEQTVDLIDRRTQVTAEELAWLKAETGEAGKSASGKHFELALDLSNAAPGTHTLKLAVDPENKFDDLERSNNEATLTFDVLPPGGTVKVRVLDQWTNKPIRDAGVVCPGLFAGRTNATGEMVVRDVPAGHYDADSIYAYKRWGDPEYVQRSPNASFDAVVGQTTTVPIVLERPVTLVGDVLDAATGEALTAERVFVKVKGLRYPDLSSGPSYRIRGIPPGTQTVVASAYGYVTQEVTSEIHGQGETGECRLDLTLQRTPRATISGTVTDTNGHKLAGAHLWLGNAPRGADADANGHYEITEVACDRDYGVWAQKKGYATEAATVANLTGGSVRTQNLQLAKVINRHKDVGVECCAWAQFEQFPGMSIGPAKIASYEVSAKHGNFRLDMGVLYRTVAGRQGEYIDQVVIATDGLAFWQSNVQSSYDVADMFSAGISKTKATLGGITGVAKTAKKAYGYFAKGVKVINKVYDYLKGDLDPNEEYNAQVYGDYTSNTGAELERAALIPLPSTEVDVALGFEGGKTVVRVDRVVVSDASGNSVTVHKQWYSPAMWAYKIGENMDLDSLEVTVYLQVLNDRLSVGPLWATSRNVITWKPNVNGSLEMHPEHYTVVP